MRDHLHVVDQVKGHLSAMSKTVVSDCHIYNLGIGTGFPVLQGQGPSGGHVEDHGVRLPYLQPGHRHRLPGPARSRAICLPCRRPWCQIAISTTWASAPASRSCKVKGHLAAMWKIMVSDCHIYNLGIGTGFPVLQGQGPSGGHVEDHGVRLPYLQPGHRHRLPGPARSRAIWRPCRRP